MLEILVLADYFYTIVVATVSTNLMWYCVLRTVRAFYKCRCIELPNA